MADIAGKIGKYNFGDKTMQEKKWTGIEYQTPNPKIEVYFPFSDK
jgi:hypothetical protein